jgi:hypothetical protein
MVGVGKQEIRDRLKTGSVWVTNDRTPVFAAVDERKIRYLVALWISGNGSVAANIQFERLNEAGGYDMLWSPIPVAATEFRQIPEGGYSVEDPIAVFEGGTRLYGKVPPTGVSLNVTAAYWDNDI